MLDFKVDCLKNHRKSLILLKNGKEVKIYFREYLNFRGISGIKWSENKTFLGNFPPLSWPTRSDFACDAFNDAFMP